MQLRRALALILTALVVATGCVTVRPAAPPDAPLPGPASAGATQARQPASLALPLSPLPGAAEPALPESPAPSPSSAPPEARPAPVPAAAERQHRPPRRAAAKPPRHQRPAKQAKPAAPAKPRKRPPTVAKPRPAPQRTFDMAQLCEAAKGTVSPSIVALCR
ncbi:hypothetical protein OG753_06605 [Streptomyces sp. NBC_00029]|uniref:hypothetical protein n=1 Tax=Streptomyces sp. NBC_00029 TaxID=2903613 RepID=UPI0032535B21